MAFQLALGCNTVGYSSVHRQCCTCTSNDQARQILLAQLGLSTITASGGPVVSTATEDYKKKTCSPFFPDGSTNPDYPAFDFSGSVSAAITSTPASAGYGACPPALNTSTQNPLGALEWACVSGNLNARGFAYRSGFDCPRHDGVLALDWFCTFRANVVFTCEANVSKYVLGIRTSVMVFVINPSAHFAGLPTIGADWTRSDSTGQSIFTRVGSTATDGAFFSVVFVRSLGVGSVFEYIGGTFVSNPTTSVTQWVPDPIIDWTGLTHVGTATLT